MDRSGWKRIRGKLPGGYEWGVQLVKKRNRKSRAIEKMLMGIRWELIERERESGK